MYGDDAQSQVEYSGRDTHQSRVSNAEQGATQLLTDRNFHDKVYLTQLLFFFYLRIRLNQQVNYTYIIYEENKTMTQEMNKKTP